MSSRKRSLWKVSGESSIWNNYPTKPSADKLSRLFVLETENASKQEFVCSAFNSNGSKLATLDQRGTIHEFDFKSYKCETVARCGSTGRSLCYSPKYDDIAVALNNRNINIFECGSYKLCATIKTQHEDHINHIQYAFIKTSSKLVLMSCSSDIIILWDTTNNYQRLQCLSHNYSIIFGLMSLKFQSIVTCFANDMISFWDWTDYSEKYQLHYANKPLLKEKIGHKHFKLICGDIDDKNGLMVTGGRGRYIYLWMISKNILSKCIVLPVTIKHVIQLKFLQNHPSNIILVLGDDGQIVAINHKTLAIAFYIQRTSKFITSFVATANNKKIACVLSDGSIEIMSIKSLCKNHKAFECGNKSKSDINSVMMQPLKLSSFDLSFISDKKSKSEQKKVASNGSTKTKPLKLSVGKLSNYLSANDCYADKYRLIIWKFLLNLPNLQNVYKHHEQNGINQNWQSKINQINDVHIRSKQRLLKMLSLLSNWCKLCEHIDFLPSFIYPFIKLYKKNDMECFECLVMILCKYCNQWFINFPDPSLKILSTWNSILRHFDESLFEHFKHHKIKIEFNLWHILTNGFSSFFNGTDWLRIWDHILTNPPIFFHILPISIILCCKTPLKSMHDKKDIYKFFEHQQQIYVKNVIDKAYLIIKKLPKTLSDCLIFKQVTHDLEQYPIFNQYPVQSVTLLRNKYEQKVQQQNNEKEHDELLKKLQFESEQIAATQKQFRLEQEMMDYLYKQKISALQSEEQQNALNKKQKTEQIASMRLEAVKNIQNTMNEMMNHQNKIKQLGINDIDNQMLHQKKISKIEHDRTKHASALNKLECETRDKLHSIQMQQNIDAQRLKLQRMQAEFDKEQKLKQQLLDNAVSSKENLSNLQFINSRKLLLSMNNLQNDHDNEQAVKHKLKIESLLNDNRKNEIEEEMKLTDLMNEQLNISQNMLAKQSKLQNILKNQEDFEMDIMCNEHETFKQNIKKKNEHILSEHKDELLKQLKQQQAKLNKLAKKQRLKHFETMLKKQQEDIVSNANSKDEELQNTIDLVKKQIENLHDKEMELELREKEILEKNAFEQIAKDAEKQIVNQETQKYANIRERMLKEMQDKEERLRQRHEEIMNNLMKEREEQLLSIGQNAKDDAYKQNMNDLEREYEEKKRELRALKENFDEKQEAIRERLIEHNLSNVSNVEM